jgi:hypothetical protein
VGVVGSNPTMATDEKVVIANKFAWSANGKPPVSEIVNDGSIPSHAMSGNGRVDQLAESPRLERGGCRFESDHGYYRLEMKPGGFGGL